MRAETKAATDGPAGEERVPEPAQPGAYTTPVTHMGVSVAVWVLKTEAAGSHQGRRRPARKKSDSERRASR